MSRKDYELIANIISEIGEVVDERHHDIIVTIFTEMLENTQPRFNQEKFVKACGL